ncbi:uncharacterized protein SCHCODRAFT_02513060 [Schizophyllum commune H4-8]|nr:uncharacterized protein SCHCODRAFT_02513060 [Schizophyllum commune H4-8]KAI5888363.1 hypothetical protein SCHCODRAFT_02513060 [Schizophyllum commune H4-8]
MDGQVRLWLLPSIRPLLPFIQPLLPSIRPLLTTCSPPVLELGAGTGLPSILLSTRSPTPSPNSKDSASSLIVVTDHPDPTILGNLQANVARNQHLVAPGCKLTCAGYEWGTDVGHLLALLPPNTSGYTTLILSDLLHFGDAHDALVASITKLSARTPEARVYVAAGTYTKPAVCANFVRVAREAGLIIDEALPDSQSSSLPDSQSSSLPDSQSSSADTSCGSPRQPPDAGPTIRHELTDLLHPEWLGTLEVGGLDKEALALRKAACRLWIARWPQ